MPDFNLQVAHYHQDGPNCWWYVHRMIHDYHTTSGIGLAKVIGALGAVAEAPMVGLPVDQVPTVLGQHHYKQLSGAEFDMKTTYEDVIVLLRSKGPLYITCYNTFDWPAGHALVLKGVVDNNKPEGLAAFPDDKQLVVLLDPAAKDKKSGGSLNWPLDYVKLLLDLPKNESHTPFWYDGENRRMQHHPKQAK